MKVTNVHECRIDVSPAKAGMLIDSLASHEDHLWPWDLWPPMRFDRPLGVGASGGHGPVRYTVEAYRPGESIRFRFQAPKGFKGHHGYEIKPDKGGVILRHTLRMDAKGLAMMSWPLFYRPLHDALIEDSLACAQVAFGADATVHPWSTWVKCLRWILSGGKGPKQAALLGRSLRLRG